jgi:hypothetical protein
MRDSGMPSQPRPGPTLRRRLGLERNDLRRRVDRVQRWAALGLLVLMLAIVAPLAVWSARWSYDAGLRAERDERVNRRQVVATVVETGGAGSAGNRYLHDTVQATWPHPAEGATAAETLKGRTARGGTLPSWKGVKVGAKKRIWVTMNGDVVGPPRPHSRTVGDAAYSAGTAVLVGGLPFLLAYWWLRRRCDRHRDAMWDTAWARMDAQRGRNSS